MTPPEGLLSARARRDQEARAFDPAAPRGPLLPPELMARVRQIQIRTHRLVNTALSGGYRSTFRGSGIEFQEVRAYQPGDEVRRIDWNVTARTGEAFVKNYKEERELSINLICDTSRSMDFGSREWTKRETAAQFCALVALVALRAQDRVGLVLFGDQPGLHLPERKGGQHVLRIVREVIAAPPTSGGSDFAAVLEHQTRVLRRRSVVFFVSDFLEDADAVVRRLTPSSRIRGRAAATGVQRVESETTASDAVQPPWTELLARLARRHDVIAVRVVDPLEVELPRAGLIELAEIETGRRLEIDTRSRAVRDEWAARAVERRERLVAALARARVDLVELDTTRDIGEPVRSFFRRRVQRYGGKR